MQMKMKKLLSTIIYGILIQIIKCKRSRNSVPANSITVIFMAALGDFFVFCSAAKALRECGYEIHLICHEGGGIEEIAEISGLFNKVTPIPKRYSARIKNIRMLQKIETQYAFAAPLGRHILPDLYLMALRANKRFVPDTMLDCDSRYLKQKIERRADQVVELTDNHERVRYERFLHETGLAEKKLAPYVFLDARQGQARKYIEVFPGAGGGKEKCWPPERYAQVILDLRKHFDAEVLILGTKNDAEYAKELQCRLGGTEGVHNLCGTTTLTQLRTLLEEACIVLANDSGSAHMSIACDTPTVVVAGGWQYGRFYPDAALKPYHRAVMACPEKLACIPCGESRPSCRNRAETAPCVLNVSVNEVFAAAICCMGNYKQVSEVSK